MKLNLLAVKKNYAGHCDSCEQFLALEGLRQKCKVEKAGLSYEKKKGKTQLFNRGSLVLKTLPFREALSRGTLPITSVSALPTGEVLLEEGGGAYVQRRKG